MLLQKAQYGKYIFPYTSDSMQNIPKTADNNGIIINGFGGILPLELSDLSIGE